jgi:hypothetical protein
MRKKSQSPVAVPSEEVSQASPTTTPSHTHSTTSSSRKSTVRLSSTFDTLDPKEDPDTTHIIDYQLMINHIAVFDLVDTGTRFDEQDPLVSVRVGTATAETARQEDAGVNANFPESFIFDLTEEDANGEVCRRGECGDLCVCM